MWYVQPEYVSNKNINITSMLNYLLEKKENHLARQQGAAKQ